MQIGADFFIQNGVGAPPGVNGEKAISCHGGNLLGKDARSIDDQRGIYRSPVGGHAGDAAVFDLHTQHRRIQKHPDAVLDGVFRIGNGQAVGTDAAGGGV